jgi:CRISPR/Cas system CMR subunit Cmr4 (Cas7 group RAMP superfamily)
LVGSDPVWQEIAQRLVVISDGTLSSLTRLACELAQHIRVDSQIGAAAPGSFFTQENVPVETLFYGAVHCLRPRPTNPPSADPEELELMAARLHRRVFQFGSDASTGLGLCTVEVKSAS